MGAVMGRVAGPRAKRVPVGLADPILRDKIHPALCAGGRG